MRHTLIFHTIGLSKKLQKIVGFRQSSFPLSYTQASALLVINSRKEINQREIAFHLHLEPASVVSLIDELERLKLVKRLSPNGDRRKYHIVLTEKGKMKLKEINNQIYKLDDYLKTKLSSEEIMTFFSTLEKLTAYLDGWKGGENEIPSTKRHLAP